MAPFLNTQTSEQNSIHKQSTQENILSDILEQELLCLEQLIQLLKTENAAIAERKTTLLDSLLDKKLMMLSKLEQQDKQRQIFFEQQTGVLYNSFDFSRFIHQHPSQTIQSSWLAVKTKLPECKEQNELNGRMIAVRKNNTEQLLQILSGQPVNNTQTYSHLGQARANKKTTLYNTAV